jgi:NADH dehydrogenase
VILVTGGTGFVGSHIVNALTDADKDVRVLERKPGSWQEAGVRCREAVQGDMTDPESLRRAVAGCDTVVHLVAIRQGKPEQFQRVMSEGTRDLVAAAKEAGVRRLVLISALGTTDETKDLVPYYRAKWDMEQTVKGSGLDHVIFRPAFIFARDGGILPTFRRLAKLMPVTPIPGSGTQRIQPIWIDDLVAYFVKAIDLDAATNRLFEVGGPDKVTWNELWERLKRALGSRRPSVHVPMGVMRAQAVVLERLPGNIPVTRDLLKMMEAGDNVVSDDEAVRTFGLSLVPLEEQLRRAA